MKQILVIEDNGDLASNTAELLELSNYEVMLASNGRIGIEIALRHQPDLIICDIMMPELDGFGVLSELQQHDKLRRVPFIFLTAKSEKHEIRQGIEMGAASYLTKPFDGNTLIETVEACLNGNENAGT